MLPDFGAHRRCVMRMLPLPPLQVVQVAAEGDGCALHGGNGDPIVNGRSTLAAHAHLDELRSNKSVPGNASITALINAGRVDRADWLAGVHMPVLAVGPVISQYGNATYLAE